MMIKNTCLVYLLMVLSFGKTEAQVVEFPDNAEWETVYDDQESIIDISPAELQSLLEKIMQFKRKRLQQLATERTAHDNNNNDNNTSNPNDLLEKKRSGKFTVQFRKRDSFLEKNH